MAADSRVTPDAETEILIRKNSKMQKSALAFGLMFVMIV